MRYIIPIMSPPRFMSSVLAPRAQAAWHRQIASGMRSQTLGHCWVVAGRAGAMQHSRERQRRTAKNKRGERAEKAAGHQILTPNLTCQSQPLIPQNQDTSAASAAAPQLGTHPPPIVPPPGAWCRSLGWSMRRHLEGVRGAAPLPARLFRDCSGGRDGSDQYRSAVIFFAAATISGERLTAVALEVYSPSSWKLR